MQKFIQNLKCEYSEKITALLKKRVSFAVSGVTNSAKLVILAQMILKNAKKLVLVVESEQNALKFQNDLKNLFSKPSVIFPFQDGCIYDTNSKNLYKYAQQVKILQNASENDIIIIPQKALFEKFPDNSFFDEHNINIKLNEDINVEELARSLVKIGFIVFDTFKIIFVLKFFKKF